MFKASTRKLVGVSGSESDAAAQTVKITFDDENEKSLEAVFAVEIIPATLALLQARWVEMIDHLAYEQRPEVQTFEAKKVQFAMNEAGEVALLVTLEGGGDVPVMLQNHMVSSLIDQAAEVLAASSDRQN